MQSRLTTNIVPPIGPLNAKILFIGEAPGKEENRHLQPFVGSSGQLLNRCLSQINLPRSSCLINNIFAQQPPGNRVNYYFTDKSNTKPTWEGQEHIDRLEAWIKRLKGKGGPNIIVALGAVAMKILTGKRRINKWRGSLLPCTLVEGFKVYPTYHPSYVNRLLNETREAIQGEKKKLQQNILPVFLIDLNRIKEQSEFPELNYPKRKYHIDLSYGEIIHRLKNLLDHTIGNVAVDIETLPGPDGPILWCIGFAYSPEEAFVVPFLKNQRFAWSIEEEAKIVELISRIFLSQKLFKLFQNGMYDLSVLGMYYGLRVADGTFHDTMWCHHSSYPYIKKGLDMLTSIYTWEPYYKDEGKVHLGKRNGDMAEFRYNGKDCCVTREILPITKRQAKELKTWEGYLKLVARIPSLLAMMLRGVKIDIEKKKELDLEFRKKVDEATQFINEKMGKEYNLNSPQQLQELLYSRLGLPIQYNMKTKAVTTDKDALNKLKRSFPNEPILQAILDSRKFGKLVSTYTSMQIAGDNRIRTSYSYISTWRLSSSESPFGSGGNLQNIPNPRKATGRAIRSLFIPDEDKLLIACDLSQAEARVVAWEAEDLAKIDAFLNPEKDVHWENSLDIFFHEKVAYEAKQLIYSPVAGFEKDMKFFRNLGKTCVHAKNYDMSPKMLQVIASREGIFLDLKLCKKLLEIYDAKNPMLNEWKRKIRDKIRATRTIISSYGRKRQFMGRINDELFRSAYAFSPQSTVGEIVEDGIMRIHAEVPEFQILLNVHDEVVGQCLPEDKDHCMKEIKKRMEIPLEIHGRELIIPADFKVGNDWGNMKEEEI